MLTDKVFFGKILVVVSVILFFMGILFIGGGPSEHLILTMIWFLGAVLFVSGLVLGFELFTGSTTMGKLGVSLMSVSAVLVVTALILFSVTTFIVHTTPASDVFTKMFPTGIPNVFIRSNRPYEWALTPLAAVALFFFGTGFLMKLYDAVF